MAQAVHDQPFGKTHLLDLTEPLSVDVKSRDSFMIVICLEGQGELKDSGGNAVALQKCKHSLIDRQLKAVLRINL